MKVFVVLSAVVACALAKPGFLHAPLAAPLAYSAPLAYAAPAVAPVVEVASQYHAQDNLGQFNYGYADGRSSKVEAKGLDGVTRGGYSYVDPNGKVQSVEYTADAVNGFKIVKASNLPEAPAVPVVAPAELPKPVEDTVEVAAARKLHLDTVEEVKARNAVAPVEVPAPVIAAAPISYAAAPAIPYSGLPLAYSGLNYGYGLNAYGYSGLPLAYSAYNPIAYKAW